MGIHIKQATKERERLLTASRPSRAGLKTKWFKKTKTSFQPGNSELLIRPCEPLQCIKFYKWSMYKVQWVYRLEGSTEEVTFELGLAERVGAHQRENGVLGRVNNSSEGPEVWSLKECHFVSCSWRKWAARQLGFSSRARRLATGWVHSFQRKHDLQ